MHGAEYTALRMEGDLGERAERVAAALSPVVAVVGIAFLIWTVTLASQQGQNAVWSAIPAAIGAVALLGAAALNRFGPLSGAALAASAVGIAGLVATLFVALYPRVMVSSTNAANSLTVQNSSSAQYTLTVMTVAAAILVPIIVLYQIWTYRVFRARIQRRELQSPADVMFPKPGKRPQVE